MTFSLWFFPEFGYDSLLFIGFHCLKQWYIRATNERLKIGLNAPERKVVFHIGSHSGCIFCIGILLKRETICFTRSGIGMRTVFLARTFLFLAFSIKVEGMVGSENSSRSPIMFLICWIRGSQNSNTLPQIHTNHVVVLPESIGLFILSKVFTKLVAGNQVTGNE